jgi:probable rRNA maturation factor
MQDSTCEPNRRSASHHILITVNSTKWPQENLDLQELCTRLFQMVTKSYAPVFEVSILFASNDEIQKLNATYRGKDKPTNVLSFPSGLFHPEQNLPVIPLGDVVLAYEIIDQEAKDKGVSFQDHLSHLLIHGYLHLLGYDHEQDEEAEVMEALEIQHLQALGIKNPYLMKE